MPLNGKEVKDGKYYYSKRISAKCRRTTGEWWLPVALSASRETDFAVWGYVKGVYVKGLLLILLRKISLQLLNFSSTIIYITKLHKKWRNKKWLIEK